MPDAADILVVFQTRDRLVEEVAHRRSRKGRRFSVRLARVLFSAVPWVFAAAVIVGILLSLAHLSTYKDIWSTGTLGPP